MADLAKFQGGLADVFFNPYGDAQFETLRTVCRGMSGMKTAKLLNFGVSCLDEKEVYLEIGVFMGFTMIAAGLGNPRTIIGIDNGSEFGNHRDDALANFNRFTHPAYQYIENDFRNVEFVDEEKRRIGLLYIDGKHNYAEVVESLKWAETLLSEKAIIIVDDLAVNGVDTAIEDWLRAHDNCKILFWMNPHFRDTNGNWKHDLSIGLGLAVLKRVA